MKRWGLPWVFVTDEGTRVDVDRKTYDVVSYRLDGVPSSQWAWDVDHTIAIADRWMAARGLDLGEPKALIERRGHVNVVYDEPVVNGISTGGLRSFIVQVREDEVVGYTQPPRVKFVNARPKISPEQAGSATSTLASHFRLGQPILMYILTDRTKVVDGAYVADIAYVFPVNEREHKWYEYGDTGVFVDAMTGERIDDRPIYGGLPKLSNELPVIYREKRRYRPTWPSWYLLGGAGLTVAFVGYVGYRFRKARRPKIAA